MKARRTRIALAVATVSGAILAPALLDAPAYAGTVPVITNLPFSFTASQVAAMPGEVSPGNTATTLGLYYPEGIAAYQGNVFVSNTNDNMLGELSGSPLAPSIFAGSYQGYGEAGDGGPATSATLYSPGGIAVDASGDVFIADTEDNVVREVYGPSSPKAGQIVLVAGNGTPGYKGDNGPAASAELDSPQAVAVDAAGDVFIADTYNNAIREVSPTGTITTFAGNGTAGYTGDNGPATSAELDDPSGVAVDALGNVYIADTSQQRDPPGPGPGDRGHRNASRSPRSPATTPPTSPTVVRVDSVATAGRRPTPSSTPPKAWRWTMPATCSSPTRSTTPSARSFRTARSPPS